MVKEATVTVIGLISLFSVVFVAVFKQYDYLPTGCSVYEYPDYKVYIILYSIHTTLQ